MAATQLTRQRQRRARGRRPAGHGHLDPRFAELGSPCARREVADVGSWPTPASAGRTVPGDNRDTDRRAAPGRLGPGDAAAAWTRGGPHHGLVPVAAATSSRSGGPTRASAVVADGRGRPHSSGAGRGYDRPTRRSTTKSRRCKASTKPCRASSTSTTWRSAAGRSAATWLPWPCSTDPTCSTPLSRARPSRTGRCTDTAYTERTSACLTNTRRPTRPVRWSTWRGARWLWGPAAAPGGPRGRPCGSAPSRASPRRTRPRGRTPAPAPGDSCLCGISGTSTSDDDCRMLVSFFSLVGLTSMSSAREFSPTIMPS